MASASATIPVGYKQTEIGVIPEDWELKTFGEIFDFKSTASNSRSDLTESDSTHYIHYGDIHTVFHRHLNLEKRETPMISRELCKNAALVRNGDWVMADASEDYSGICKAIEISGIVNESSVVAGLHTFLLRDREGTYVPGFKGHLGEAKYLHDQYVRVSVGLKVFGVTKTSLRDLFIPVPPKIEQTRIEEILTDSDSQIQALENLIQKKRDIKQGTVQELLTGNTRLPGFSGKWKKCALMEVGSVTMGQSPPGKSYTDDVNETPLINGAVELTKKGILIKKYTNKPTRLSKIGDFLFCIRATIGNLQISDKIYCLGRGVASLTPHENCSKHFIYHQLNNLFQAMKDKSEGGVILGLKKVDVENFPLIIPDSFKEQEAIGILLSDMDAEITALEQRLEKTKAIKQGMMQQLLTGRIRLVDPSTPAEASA